MTLVRIMAVVVGVSLFVLGVIRMVHGYAASLSAHERGDAQGRREAGSAAIRRVWPLAVGPLLIELSAKPFTDRRTFGVVVVCAAVYALGTTVVMQWRGLVRGGWRWAAAGSFLAGLLYGVSIASAVNAHSVRYAALLFVPILLVIVALLVMRHRKTAA